MIELLKTIWIWIGIGIAFFSSLALLLCLIILAVNELGRSMYKKLAALYDWYEISYWLEQHRKFGKIEMSDEKGRMVWIQTKKSKEIEDD